MADTMWVPESPPRRGADPLNRAEPRSHAARPRRRRRPSSTTAAETFAFAERPGAQAVDPGVEADRETLLGRASLAARRAGLVFVSAVVFIVVFAGLTAAAIAAITVMLR